MYKELIQKSLDYIEDNLKTEIQAQELCQLAGFSLFHYYRLFQMAVGMPVMQYVLRRKLLNAIYEISLGDKMIDVALAYGFETHAGFYKAFNREFGMTPTQFLKSYKVKKPYRIDILKEEHIMVTHKKVTELLKNWGLEKEKVTDIIYEETGNRSDSACYVGEEYVMKFSPNLGKITTNITISRKLDEMGLLVSLPVNTLAEEEFIMDGELYFCLYRRIKGRQLKVSSLYEEDIQSKARFIGEVIGHLDEALREVDALVEAPNLYESVIHWALPSLKDSMLILETWIKEYKEVFGKVYAQLPKQVIHRDPNPGNMIMDGDKWGFIDFELSERNLRIFDPCYAATAILSESFVQGDKEKGDKWLQIYHNIIQGYGDVLKLSKEEKVAIPYVVMSNQLIALAWFAGQEKYKDIYETNKKMTIWLLNRFDELKVE
ncbi:MAG: helix-turn-helix domain-containing protein [Lachnospiraceae bacterium]|nr:helix-turn-helix domain-containing protein [Lachnospiraceae bacterium]